MQRHASKLQYVKDRESQVCTPKINNFCPKLWKLWVILCKHWSRFREQKLSQKSAHILKLQNNDVITAKVINEISRFFQHIQIWYLVFTFWAFQVRTYILSAHLRPLKCDHLFWDTLYIKLRTCIEQSSLHFCPNLWSAKFTWFLFSEFDIVLS